VFDEQMKFVAEWKQFGRPSGLTIIDGQTLVVTDWESGGPVTYPDVPGEPLPPLNARGIRNAMFMQGRPKTTTFGRGPSIVGVASTVDGSIVTSFETKQAEGVGADRMGNIIAGPWKYASDK